MALIVFDGDDTLWLTEELYDRARDAAAEIVEAVGIDRRRFIEEQKAIDLANVERMGLSPDRFPRSSVEAYERLAPVVRPEVSRAVDRASRQVFDADADLVPHAEATLAKLSGRHKLVLVTKGDPQVQQARVDHSGLGSYFDDVLIVGSKTPELFAELAERYDVSAADVVSVGNSLASDINPALAAGLNAVWIDAHVWEHERRELVPIAPHAVEVESLSDVPRAIEALLNDAETRAR